MMVLQLARMTREVVCATSALGRVLRTAAQSLAHHCAEAAAPLWTTTTLRWLNVNEFTRPRQRRRGPVGHAQRRPRRPQAAHRWDHVLCDWLVENCRELYSGGSGGSSGGGGGIFPRFKQTMIHGRLDRQSVCALPQGGAGL